MGRLSQLVNKVHTIGRVEGISNYPNLRGLLEHVCSMRPDLLYVTSKRKLIVPSRNDKILFVRKNDHRLCRKPRRCLFREKQCVTDLFLLPVSNITNVKGFLPERILDTKHPGRAVQLHKA